MESGSSIANGELRTVDVEGSEATLVSQEKRDSPGLAPLPSAAVARDTLEEDPFMVKLNQNDPSHPKNLSSAMKWYSSVLAVTLAFNTTFASSAPAGAIGPISERFELSEIVATLTITLFVTGYIFGPLLWGPLSESYGRRPFFLFPFAFYTLTQVGSALAPNITVLLTSRFLGGFFAAAPLTNSGALCGDLWDTKVRGNALAFFTFGPIVGLIVSPMVAGFMTDAGVSWRWVFGLLAASAGLCTVLVFLTMPETYEPRLAALAARRKRKETCDERYYAPIEQRNIPFSQRLQDILAKPFKILFSEPMLIAITIYQSFIYGCVYLLLGAYPIVFSEGHGLNAGLTGLAYTPVAIGAIIGCFSYIYYWNPRHMRHVDAFAPNPVPPEYRLEMATWAAVPYAVAFFWFGWTSYPTISLWAPVSQGIIMGWAIVWLYLSQLNYIVDTYLFAAASALASNTVVRSIVGAAFPLFAKKMYRALGPRWASTALGTFALLCVPIPFVLIRYGPILRAKSKFSHKEPAPPKNDTIA